jgi:hypothetical protein
LEVLLTWLSKHTAVAAGRLLLDDLGAVRAHGLRRQVCHSGCIASMRIVLLEGLHRH